MIPVSNPIRLTSTVAEAEVLPSKGDNCNISKQLHPLKSWVEKKGQKSSKSSNFDTKIKSYYNLIRKSLGGLFLCHVQVLNISVECRYIYNSTCNTYLVRRGSFLLHVRRPEEVERTKNG